jgi:glycosyltransferase involved in cell wall biosynthesis
MNIAVNTRLLLKDKLEGIGWFSYETLKRIVIAHPEHTFYFIFDRPWDKEFIFAENVIPIKAGPPTRHPFLWIWWFELTIPRILKKIKADIFISPDGYLSLRSKLPAIPVIHDVNFVHNPKQLPKLVSWYYNYFFKRFAKKAIRVGTVSEYSKQDISKSFNIPPDKIDVIYNGSNLMYSPIEENVKVSVRAKYTNNCPYFTFVGAINPRKNVPGLLKSFDIYKEKTGYSHKLVIVGSAMHLTGEVDTSYENMTHKKDVVFVGRLDVAELHKVLASAEALVLIPYFEGFGIPLVEAMYCDIPLICSDVTSVPEVAGKAALKSSPDDHQTVAMHMQSIVEDSELRNNLIEEGRKQRQKFSWDKSAVRFWKCIENAINQIDKNA